MCGKWLLAAAGRTVELMRFRSVAKSCFFLHTHLHVGPTVAGGDRAIPCSCLPAGALEVPPVTRPQAGNTTAVLFVLFTRCLFLAVSLSHKQNIISLSYRLFSMALCFGALSRFTATLGGRDGDFPGTPAPTHAQPPPSSASLPRGDASYQG